MARLALVAALDRHRAIGRDNAMPWHLPADLQHFKALTLGGTVLMGRRTLDAIGRPLPRRRNLVLSRSGFSIPGTETVTDLAQARTRCQGEWLWVIGGGEVYVLALPQSERMVLTHVEVDIEGADTWFPAFDPAQWRVESETRLPADERNAYPMAIVDYRRAP